ncbi:hypothetical protein FISHEDRAFT_26124, partial [Fistulina hepatica ATCC 64428]
VVEGYIDPGLADDVVGRIDVTTTFVGQELNIEYLFGLFLETTRQNATQLIGSPVRSQIQSVALQPPVTSVSFITDMYYSTVDYTIPLQIDMFINWDDSLAIRSYDATLRRWDQLFDYLMPRLAPAIAEEFGETYEPGVSNITNLIARRAATDVCEIAMEHCLGENQQYDSLDHCMHFLTVETPFGRPYEGGLNTGWCRYVHKNMVKYRPDVHCDHIGPSGGDMCIARDYMEIVDEVPFTHTLL